MDFYKIQKFLFSNKNIFGCALATIILILGIIGFLKTLWLPIAVMAYVFGYIAAPGEKEIKFHHIQGQNLNDYSGFVKKLLDTISKSTKLPGEAKTIINHICQNALDLITFIENGNKNYSLSEDLINLTSIFDSYLPKIINQYERLPSKYANEVKSSNGKTAREMLLEQLSVLDKKMEEIAYGMYEDDVTALKANGYFLKEKFGKEQLFEIEING